MINNLESGATLFWQSTAQWSSLTQEFKAYEPYITSKINNLEA